MKKKCCTCQKEKLLKQFNKKKDSQDGHQTICKDCSKAKSRAYYAKNAEHHKKITTARKNQSKEDNRQKLYEYFTNHPCVDCGESDVRCLEFDHVRGKKSRNVSDMCRNVCSWKTILKEIAKCDVRCANCHRKRTSDTRNWYKSTPGP